MKKTVSLFLILLIVVVPSCDQSTKSSFEYEIINNTVAILSHNNVFSTSISIPEKIEKIPVTTLGSNAFYQHQNLELVILPETLTTINGSPFYRCYSLKEIHIPRNVIKIDSNPVFRCNSLKKITVDPNNTYFIAVDGVLYNKEKTQLIAYPEGKTDEIYIVPKTIEKLEIDAFGYHPKFKKVIIFSNVEDFPEGNVFVFPDDITLYVEYGSAAEQYARTHNLNFEIISQSGDG